VERSTPCEALKKCGHKKKRYSDESQCLVAANVGERKKMNRYILPILTGIVTLVLSANASAEWQRLVESPRLVMYTDSGFKKKGDKVTGWVMFDYKAVQVSPLSGRKYLTEQNQIEVNCETEQKRIIFLSWHADNMGAGKVVYKDTTPTAWETTTAPQSIGSAAYNYFCKRQ
jgi:hypothetical protein